MLNITVHPPHQQATGGFDGGKITEQKPIGFPGEGSAVKGVGPLFYWAWAQAKEEGFIPSHPHQVFEIITYMVQGQAEHGDSLGTKSTIGPGGIQVMQTGSGVNHEERFIGPDMEGFQIWFEPYVREAINRPPTYNQYDHNDFPIVEKQGVQIKEVLGEQSPVDLVVDVKMWDVTLSAGSSYQHSISNGRTLSSLAIRGDGLCSTADQTKEAIAFQHKDFILLAAEKENTVSFQATDDEKLRLILIDVPTEVDYPLYFG